MSGDGRQWHGWATLSEIAATVFLVIVMAAIAAGPILAIVFHNSSWLWLCGALIFFVS
jgi:hypothetical protein